MPRKSECEQIKSRQFVPFFQFDTLVKTFLEVAIDLVINEKYIYINAAQHCRTGLGGHLCTIALRLTSQSHVCIEV